MKNETRLREALKNVRAALLSPVNELAIADTLWMPHACPETLIDYIDSELAATSP